MCQKSPAFCRELFWENLPREYSWENTFMCQKSLRFVCQKSPTFCKTRPVIHASQCASLLRKYTNLLRNCRALLRPHDIFGEKIQNLHIYLCTLFLGFFWPTLCIILYMRIFVYTNFGMHTGIREGTARIRGRAKVVGKLTIPEVQGVLPKWKCPRFRQVRLNISPFCGNLELLAASYGSFLLYGNMTKNCASNRCS